VSAAGSHCTVEPQTLFAPVVQGEHCKPEQSADDLMLVQRIVVSCFAVSPCHCCAIMRDAMEKAGARDKWWRVLVDLAHGDLCLA
jgi:hypothetical protein